MNPTILGVIGPGFLNQVPEKTSRPEAPSLSLKGLGFGDYGARVVSFLDLSVGGALTD